MPIPPKLKAISIARGIKGFENREFTVTFSVASPARLRGDCGAFLFSENNGEYYPDCLTGRRSLVNIPVCLAAS